MDHEGIPQENAERPTFYRKILRIRAEDSPNVKLGLEEERLWGAATGRVILPGVLPYDEYRKRRDTWDAVRQSIGLDAEFWEGAETLLYPPMWLNAAEAAADELARARTPRIAKAIGIDPAEGGDKTSMAACDEYGLIEVVARKTPNTNVIHAEAIAFGRRHNVRPEDWVFDRGGGGQQHADRLRGMGFNVRTVAFGEPVTPPLRRHTPGLTQRDHEAEERYAYLNRRAEMYGTLRLKLDTALSERVFALPAKYTELRRQLSLMPLRYDAEGRMYLPPKRKKHGSESTQETLEEILGCSPDEADALVLAVYGVFCKSQKSKIRAAW